jgi:mRNA-degrading endonuclease toxin of MazEF toxin-antitoxin module
MAQLVRGAVVYINFPYADRPGTQRRPALILANAYYGDFVLCQITTTNSALGIEITATDFEDGKLTHTPSYVRWDRLFTARINVDAWCGKLTSSKMDEIMEKVRKLFA